MNVLAGVSCCECISHTEYVSHECVGRSWSCCECISHTEYVSHECVGRVGHVVDVKGTLTMHGISNEVSLKAQITPGKGKISASAEIKVTPEAFGIQIPSAVRDKIAKEVTIKIDADYTP